MPRDPDAPRPAGGPPEGGYLWENRAVTAWIEEERLLPATGDRSASGDGSAELRWSLPAVRRVVRSTALEWRVAAPVLIGLFLAGRAIAVVAALLGEFANPARPGWQLTTSTPILRSLDSWDTVYYAGIAAGGYSAQPIVHGDTSFPNYVFFPALPALMRLLHAVTGIDFAIAGLLINNICFALALACLYVLGRRYFSDRQALIATAFVALAPGAAGFAMAYGDGLFLLLGVSACLAAETRHNLLAAACFAGAALTRLPGITLGLPLLLILVAADGWRPTRRWAMLAAGPVALGAFYAYLWSLTGDPLANLHGQDAWSSLPLPPLAPAILAGFALLVAAMIAIYAASAAITYRSWRKRLLPLAYTAYAVVGLVVVVVSLRIALPRYVSVLFPLSWGFAAHPRWRALLVASTVLYAAFAFAAFGPGLAP